MYIWRSEIIKLLITKCKLKTAIALPSLERKVHESPGEFLPFLWVEVHPRKKNQTLCWQCCLHKAQARVQQHKQCNRRSKIFDWPRDGGCSILQALEGLAAMWELTPGDLEATTLLPSGWAWDYTVFSPVQNNSLTRTESPHWSCYRCYRYPRDKSVAPFSNMHFVLSWGCCKWNMQQGWLSKYVHFWYVN